MRNTSFKLIAFLYKQFIKPILFLIPPEVIHESFTVLGSSLGKYSFTQLITKLSFFYSSTSLTKEIDGITFSNPVGLSAGYDYNGDLTAIIPSVGFGWHTIGTVTFEPYAGNSKPWLGRFPNSKALLVNKGLKSLGAKKIITKLKNKSFNIPVGISIGSTNKQYHSLKEQLIDIGKCFLAFEKSTVDHSYYELNISCPNTFGGEPFSNPKRLEMLLKMIDQLTISKPIYVKMPIDQNKEATLAILHVLDKHNIQGVILGNLTKDKTNPAVEKQDALDWQTKKGNLSGKPTWDRSNALIKLTKKHYKNRFTIVGTGGIFTGEDAAYKLSIGADLVQLITGMVFNGPQTIGQINYHLVNNTN